MSLNTSNQPNQEHIDRIAELVERRVVAAALLIQEQFSTVIRNMEMRAANEKENTIERFAAFDKINETRNITLRELIFERFAYMEKARDLQAIEYGRRLEGLNHEHARIADLQNTFVRLDTNEKDWDRLRAEHLADQVSQQQSRLIQETTVETTRRNTLLGVISGAIAMVSLGISVLLHFTALPRSN